MKSKKLILLIAILICGVNAYSQNETEDKNTATLLAVYDGYNKRDYSVIDKYFDPHYIDHTPTFGSDDLSFEGIKKSFQSFEKSFPDYKMNVEDIFASGNKVMVRLLVTGTNKGELMNLPPTNKEVKVPGLVYFIFKDGLISERWGFYDTESLYKQLGIKK